MAIKVNELKEARKNNAKEVQVVNCAGLDIKVKPMSTVSEKLELAQTIYEVATDQVDGITVLDGNSLHIAKVYFIVKNYTDITLPKDYFESFDIIYELGIYDAIKEVISSDISDIETMIKNIINREEGFELKKKQLGYVIESLMSGLKSMDINTLLQGLDVGELKRLIPNESK